MFVPLRDYLPIFFQTYGGDPVFVAFARSMLEVIGSTPDRDKVSFVCDDEEEVAFAFHMFRLYRRVKRILFSLTET
jgi:hypothetical protein